MPRKKYDKVKVNFVGRFFEDLTRAIISCEKAPAEEGDFHIWNSGFGIEVKSSDVNHEFRLPLHQIDTFRRMSGGFPFNHFFLFLFCYRNPNIKDDDNNTITSLSVHNEKVPVRDFLARNLDTLFILDMTVLEFLFSVCRISDKSIPLHPGVKSLNIRPAYLKRLMSGGWQAMTGKAKNFQPTEFDCNFNFEPDLLESYRLKMRIVTLGSNREMKRLVSSFNLKPSEIKSPQ